MTDPKFVAFSTQKGGAGKTTLTVLAASYLYYVKGLKVLVVDCDYPQYSIEEMRQRGNPVHPNTVEARDYLLRGKNQ